MWVCGLDWAGPGQGRVAELVSAVMNLRVPYKCGEFLD